MKDDSVRHTNTTHGRGWAIGCTPTILGGFCKIQQKKGPGSPLFVTRDHEGYVGILDAFSNIDSMQLSVSRATPQVGGTLRRYLSTATINIIQLQGGVPQRF